MRNVILSLLLVLGLAGLSLAQDKPEAKTKKPSAAKTSTASSGAPDKKLMDEIWAGWSTKDPANVAKYYAKGPGHVFYDITPLKYDSWEEYEKGVREVLAGFESINARPNDDAQVHRQGNLAWGSATVHHDDVLKDGKHDTGDFRWTVVWEKKGADWLIVHEHVSAPLATPPPPEQKTGEAGEEKK